MTRFDSISGGNGANSDLLQELLVKTSRTFALAIPMLPQPTLNEVSVAYLLFRIADTFEDASVLWNRSRQLAALDDFVDLLNRPSVSLAREMSERWLDEPPTRHAGYLELLAKTPEVIASHLELSAQAQEVVAHHTIRTTLGMASVVDRTDDNGVLRLSTIEDVQAYCYIVAGIVGEMLTDLFLLERDHLEAIEEYLKKRDAQFGEGLQLVNILKDSADDAVEGRNYIPPTIDRHEVFALARLDLEAATEYTLAIQEAGGPDGIVLFTGLPVELAWATLRAVEEQGPGAKISRAQVFALHRRIQKAVRAGAPAVNVPEF